MSGSSVQADAMAAAGQFLQACAERNSSLSSRLLVEALGPHDDGAYAFAYALATITTSALNETAKVLDVEGSQIREVVISMASSYFEKEAAHG